MQNVPIAWTRLRNVRTTNWLLLSGFSSSAGFLVAQATFMASNALVPYADVIEPRIRRSNDDLFLSSYNESSGRAPFDQLMTLAEGVLGSTEVVFSFLSAVVIACTLPLVVAAFLRAAGPFPRVIHPSAGLLLLVFSFFQERLSHYFAIAGYGYVYSEFLRPTNVSLVILSIAVLLSGSGTFTKLLVALPLAVAGCLLHPAVGVSALLAFGIVSSLAPLGRGNAVRTLSILSPLFFGVLIAGIVSLSRLSTVELNPEEFAELYARLVHPWHYDPTVYLNGTNIGFTVLAYSMLGFALKRVRLQTFGVFCALVFANLMQWALVYYFHNVPLLALGPSRLNVFIGASLIALLIVGLSMPEKDDSQSATGSELNPREFAPSAFLIGTLVLANLSIMSAVFQLSEQKVQLLVSYATNSSRQISPLSNGRPILVQPGIQTVGWRSYGQLDIWFDSYWTFPFNAEAVQEYRRRYLEMCGQSKSANCSEASPSRVINSFVRNSEIEVLILRPDTNPQAYSEHIELSVTKTSDFLVLTK